MLKYSIWLIFCQKYSKIYGGGGDVDLCILVLLIMRRLYSLDRSSILQKFFLCFHLLPFKRELAYLPLLSALILNHHKIINDSMLSIFMCRILGTWKLKPLMKTIHSVTYLTLLFNYQCPLAWNYFRNVNNLICIWNKSIYKLKCKRKILRDFDGMIYERVLFFFFYW